MLTFPDFYRQRATRSAGRLSNPILGKFVSMDLPKDSIFIHVPDDDISFGPSVRDVPISMYDGDVMVDHVQSMTSTVGARVQQVNFQGMVRDYHKRFRKLTLARRVEVALRSSNSLMVVNLGMLPHMYRYQRTALSPYYKWSNIQNTYIAQVKRYCALTNERQMFMKIILPEVLPKLEDYKRVSKTPNTSWIKTFQEDDNAFQLMDLYLMIADDADKRAMSTYSKLTQEEANKLNIIFIAGVSWAMINVGDLKSWADESKSTDTQFLSFLDKLFEEKTPIDLEGVVGASTDPDNVTDAKLVTSTGKVDNDRGQRLDSAINEAAQKLSDNGLLSAGEKKRVEALATRYQKIKNPFGEGTLEDLAHIPAGTIESIPRINLPDIPTVFDKAMLNSSLKEMNDYYKDHLLESDVANMALQPQMAGFAVTDYKVNRVVDALNDYKIYSVQYTSISGSPSTVKIQIPTIRADGNFKANGVLYKMSPQRGDLPIRKVNPSKVALTSYYGKLFCIRGDKAAGNYGLWLTRKLMDICIQDKSPITNIRYSNVFSPNDVTTRTYAVLAERFVNFDVNGIKFYWNYSKLNEFFSKEQLGGIQEGYIPCGLKAGKVVSIDRDDNFWVHNGKEVSLLGDLPTTFGLPLGGAPLDVIEVGIFSKKIPIGILLGRVKGLKRVIHDLKAKYREVMAGTRYTLESDEYELRFADKTLIFSRSDKKAALILSGFASQRKFLAKYDASEFNTEDVYFNLLEEMGLGLRYLNEIDLIFKMFVEPITYRILLDMKEPTTFDGLLYRAAELLVTSDSPNEIDPNWMRIKGYERFSGLMYKQLVDAIRVQKSRPIATKAKLEVNPKAVWMGITTDTAVNLVEKTNPIHNIREKEILTFSGEGGRSGQSMTAPTREFHVNEMGLTSEATADSGKVAINAYATADPLFKNMRGLKDDFDINKNTAAQAWSTSALVSPAADRDDVKRINFISIQHDSGVSCRGYQVLPFRTGFEAVIAHRVDEEFAYAAKDDGKVVTVDDKHIRVTYKSSNVDDIIELGTFYGSVSGMYMPQRVISDYKAGTRFTKGTILAFNTGYFQRNRFDPTQVDWKSGRIVTTALMESNDTFEDSSAISKETADEMGTEVTTVRPISIGYKQSVHNLVSIGDDVLDDDILCIIQDAFEGSGGNFDETAIDTLSLISSASPRIPHGGKIERIEVFYRGDKDDMSPSVRKIANWGDKQRTDRIKLLENEDAKTGELTESARIGGLVLDPDTMIIMVYATKTVNAVGGDKMVFGNSLKTVPGRVMAYPVESYDGRTIDCIFGYCSINARIVLSPLIMGLMNLYLEESAKHIVSVYNGK